MLAVIIVLTVAMGVYLIPMKCTDSAALDSTETVKVTDDGSICFLDGKGDDALLIFYPGGKVEYTAYCALLKETAEKGVDCCIVRVPLNLAFLGVDRAENIIENSEYEKIYLGGHSLGGVAASMYASEHPEKLDGIVFLASYPSSDLSETKLSALTVVGDCDGVISRDKMDEAKAMLPENSGYLLLEGGNHAQFGTYGEQKGDNAAKISSEEQRELCSEAIAEFILN